MRSDVYVSEVLSKYEALKRSGFWPAEPRLRPRAWLNNFERDDQHLAAMLLDNFTYFDDRLTDRLLISAYHSIGDHLPKGPGAPDRDKLVSSIGDAVFTPVLGEDPNPTDSGNLMCRKLRQVIGVPESRIVSFSSALDHANSGNTVVFVDDFVGSGNQFNKTFSRHELDGSGNDTGRSFENAMTKTQFVGVYVSLICTDYGLSNIHSAFPYIAVCCAHVIGKTATVWGIEDVNKEDFVDISDLLRRTAGRLTPDEGYMQNDAHKALGFARRGLLLGFEHSVPDATLPVFWSKGVNDWEPLIERR